MARQDVDYNSPEEHFEVITVAVDKCEFAGTLYERSAGGFDLYLSLEPSDLKHLEASKITILRTKSDDNEEPFIESYPDSKVIRDLKLRAKQRLATWLNTAVDMK